jgi:hypothetical protein
MYIRSAGTSQSTYYECLYFIVVVIPVQRTQQERYTHLTVVVRNKRFPGGNILHTCIRDVPFQ